MAASAVSGREAAVAATTYTVSPTDSLDSISKAIEISKEGDTIEVKGGLYKERVVMDKPLIKLIGINKPVIDGEGEGTVIFIKAPGCTLKGFLVRGSGTSLNAEDAGINIDSAPNIIIEDNYLEDVLFGIYIRNSSRSLIRSNVIVGKDLPIPDRGDGIHLWYSSETTVENNRITRTRDLAIWFSNKTLIKNNRVEKGRYGLHYMKSDDNTFEDNVFTDNSVGGFLMYSRGIKFYHNIFAHNQGLGSGYGIGLKDVDDVVAEENLIIDNRIGIYLDNSPSLIDSWNRIKKNAIAFNDIGASFMPSIERNLFSKNSFIENTEQIEVRGGGTLAGNRWSEGKEGNYWSDYVGYDENKDGIGDFPYLAESLFESFIDRYPNLKVFIFSPVSQAIEFASKAFPVMKPVPKVTDNYPLIRAYIPNGFKTRPARLSFWFLIVSGFLVFVPLGLYVYLVIFKT
jgi:nitrous oxide reductase family maturation protein NosD